jgi:DNA/RNA-binding domain of Phe-tRNA-synthetase-like protein
MHTVERWKKTVQIDVNWSPDVARKFPDLQICIGQINGLRNEKTNDQTQKLTGNVYERVRARYRLETLKDDPTVRAYRDFYWKLNIDPTKTRPSGEALLRRILHGDDLPRISTVVDAYNLASMETIIPMSGFDADRLNPPFHVGFAKDGEAFVGIGMNKPLSLMDNTLVLTDERQILCIYPYRDSDRSKITLQTRNAMIIAYGSPGITENQLRNAAETTLSYIKQTSHGEIAIVKVFSNK